MRSEDPKDSPVQLLFLGMGAAAQVRNRNAGGPCPGKGPRFAVVADDDTDARSELAGCAPIQDGLEIGPSAGGQHAHAERGFLFRINATY
jgi:hypothetical protein